MTSFVYDFKDIASRMKGELKQQIDPRFICASCGGNGRFRVGDWHGVPIFKNCVDCDGTERIAV